MTEPADAFSAEMVITATAHATHPEGLPSDEIEEEQP
jgi:hypothetical protein